MTRVVVGALDLADKRAVADQLAAQIPHARKVVVPGAAHLVNMEQPAKFNQLVLAFLDGV